MPSLTGQGGYGVSKTRTFDGKIYRRAADASNKELAEKHKAKLKRKGYKVRITKRTGPPYNLKYSLWVRKT